MPPSLDCFSGSFTGGVMLSVFPSAALSRGDVPLVFRRIGVVAEKVVVGGVLQLGHACECSSPNALRRDRGEEPLDEVEPRRTGRREMTLEARVLPEPRLHFGRLV